MILHMLGGGPAQVSVIKRSKQKGFKVIVSDLDPKAPGFDFSDYNSLASTFDGEAVFKDAKRYRSSFLMTTGTDQPVLTAARVSKQLNLPYFLTPDQALIVTNKKTMKTKMVDCGIPTMPFVLLYKDFKDNELDPLTFPLVIKPLDSQGQRGILKVYSIEEIRDNFETVLSFSREDQILAEEYYESEEITVSGWVEDGKAITFIITDRVTIDNGPHLGVCISHRYPSLFHDKEEKINSLVQSITDMIGLKSGPIYFQILAGDKGFIVNEIACRLGGAYEDEFIPAMCGIPLMDIMIEITAGIKYNLLEQNQINNNLKGKILSLQMFFSRPGILHKLDGMDKILTIDGVLNGSFLLKKGTVIGSRENSTQRVGYFIVISSTKAEVNRIILEVYDSLILENESGDSMLQINERMLFPI
ncbi:MAG: ATP-grasp domain-containing protein [Spirochaetaceae bacterium]